VACVKDFCYGEPVTDAFDFLEDIHTEISVSRCGVGELLVDEVGDIVFVEHTHILPQKSGNKKVFLPLIKSFFNQKKA
jgi:hypothetical protein